MKKEFRQGAIGALMDEYERAAYDLKFILLSIPADTFKKICDPATDDPDCKSMQTILIHVVRSGYSYSNQIRLFLGHEIHTPSFAINTPQDAVAELNRMLYHTILSVGDNWLLSSQEILATRSETKWGIYDIEMMFEHAIVHILRHRRQIERFMSESK